MALVLLAGCAGPKGDWSKAGADDAATAQAYRECSELTGTVTESSAQIDQDIAATRSSDLQHSSILREQAQQRTSDFRDRSEALLASCMQAKGFTQRTK